MKTAITILLTAIITAITCVMLISGGSPMAPSNSPHLFSITMTNEGLLLEPRGKFYARRQGYEIHIIAVVDGYEHDLGKIR